ncbi:bifunctional 2-C-methyl-D-erythritol 4-phosphate cytidylyltransferase/2-C-methyl-D-erythritol 2,4-cyclodiphosphate synthase [Neogemmobacter tilapiae]|uniref:Bifunctional enzyme IspD/IspF n=1 Tax=Neogemmobacter tilapiae TaxID=875041 RepID=A0A918TEL5_9RHOB|nr:bifunctional 2-C-methyl-D-erythritol 4-phosphate cytidylyltransferase/2-C-methyl-D-erythritol 2,4-cyclodiphosphate synthase [Gemmobacter tilapiae]GHC45440.1 bifunctional enzyme IspD/IspF [Gemmobacter tilapiae]
MTVAAIILAAGRGTRAGGTIPKQWQMLGDRPVVAHALAALTRAEIGLRVLVCHADDLAQAQALGSEALIVVGGAERDASVKAGLLALQGRGVTRVLIHDGARPFPGPVIPALLAALERHQAAAPGLAVSDALWRVDQGRIAGLQDRAGLARAQTPQGFAYEAILAAHLAHSGGALDDVAVAMAAGLDVAMVPGHEDNLKLTWPEDFARAERILRGKMDIRLGNGFDVHAFTTGDHVVLCGVKIPHSKALLGHSDADVAMHALTDAIYGALAEGDIGRHFPPSDPQWKGADSAIFLAHAAELAAQRGFRLGNADVTIICERPKIGPHAAAMQARLAEIMRADVARISVKATTSEQLGFTGREEGIAAIATVTWIKE